ncbi:hypothetical protein APHAL10511_000911 [Amanita phalloides]|nr:hypothetical protein APHAL10511_000911 [Amanita phalloides]
MQYFREDLRSRSPCAPVTGQVVASASPPIYFSIGVHVDHRLCRVTCDYYRPSPFGKLPVEVVREIFWFTCGTGILAPCQRTREPPRRTLQFVCKSWRQIVVNSASLWNDLDLRIVGHEPYDSGVSLAVIGAWLHRARSWLRYAGSSALSLQLLIAWCDEVAEARRRIFSFLSIYKFKQLAVISLFPPILDLDASLDAALSCVETLALTTPTWLALPIQLQLFTHRFRFSALKSLELAVDVGFTYKYLLSAFPWHQLDRLVLGTVRRSDLLGGLLRQCKSLVDCTIYIEQGNTFFIPLQDIILPQLHRLTIISDIVGPITDAILHSIIVPSLESLSISGESRSSSPLTLYEVEAMASRSGFGDRLQKLVLRNLCEPVDLGRLLRFMPSLNIAKISGTINDEDMLHIADGSLGPGLAHISLAGCDLKLDALLDMVEQRQINASKEGSMIVSLITASFLLHQYQTGRLTDEHYERAANLEDEFNFEIGFGEESDESAWWI